MNRSLIFKESPCPLSVLQALSQVSGILFRNGKCMVLNKLHVLVPFCILILSMDLVLTPAMVDMVSRIEGIHYLDEPNREQIQGIVKDFQVFLGIELLFLIAFFFIPLFSLLATFYMSYSGKQMNSKDLFSKIDISWKRRVIKWFYISFSSTVLVALILILISVFSIILVIDIVSTILILVITILCTLCHVYIVSVWILSLVISVIEENLDGLGTIARTEDHIRGTRLQGLGLSLICSILSLMIFMGYGFSRNHINQVSGTDGFWTEIGILGYICLVKIFMFLVYTVFYYECKIRNGQQQAEVEENLLSTIQV